MNSKELARLWIDAVWNKKDTSAISQLMAHDVFGVTEGSPIQSREQFVSHLYTPFVQAFPDLHADIEGIVAEGDEAAVRWTITGTHTGPLMHLAPSGKRVRFSGITWFKFKDGKMIEGADSYNLHALIGMLSGGPETARVKLA